MRLSTAVILSIAAGISVSVPAPAAAPAPFDGAWMSCETYRGDEICTYGLPAQPGTRVCRCPR